MPLHSRAICFSLVKGVLTMLIMKVLPSGSLSADSTTAMWIQCLAQGNNILIQPRIEPSIFYMDAISFAQ